MTDVRSEIPALAYINAQIIQEAVTMGAFAKPTQQVENMYGLPAGSLRILNPAHLLGLLYCLIVVPKEFWLHDNSHPVFTRIDQDKLLSLVSISQKTAAFDQNPSYRLLRHLRNAVAHTRFTIIEDNFTFWDQDQKANKEIFRATLSLANLSEFISYVGPLLANLRSTPLRTH